MSTNKNDDIVFMVIILKEEEKINKLYNEIFTNIRYAKQLQYIKLSLNFDNKE